MATSQFTGVPPNARNIFSMQSALDQQTNEKRSAPFLVGRYEHGAHSILSRDHYATGTDAFAAGAALQAMPIGRAADTWLDWRRISLRGRSEACYRGYIKALICFFGELTLREIGPVHLRRYQAERLENTGALWHRKAGPSSVNHELNTLQQILRHAGLWAPLSNFYKPLPLPRWTPPRVMKEEDEQRFFSIAASHPDWELAGLVAMITANTTASGCELRTLQHQHIICDEDGLKVRIPSETVKNEFRGRMIPLNSEAARCMARVVERANGLGSTEPEHYLFPIRVRRGHYDPTRPASRSWLRKQFEALRVAAGLPWLRPHDLRHQAITGLLEEGVPDQTVMAIAGHVSQAMLNHYSHTRIKAKQEAVFALERSRLPKPRIETRFGW